MNNTGLPPTAKRVFKGIIFDVYQWEQKMFDGTTATFEKLKRPDTMVVIPVVGDKILVLDQEQSGRGKAFISLPGGRREEGEDSAKAAARELLEETGYIAEGLKLWKEEMPYENKIIWTVYTYIGRNCQFKQPPHLDPGEKITPRLISFNEFLLLADDPTFYELELKADLLRARFDSAKKEELRKLLFA
jgi:ADP-ribose pyrophosphatase